MRFLSGIVAFIVTFGLSVTVVGLLFGFPKVESSSQVYKVSNYNSSAKYKIRNLIRRDVRNGYYRNLKVRKIDGYTSMSESDLYNNSEYREAISEYVRRSSNISDAGMPEDFQYAWRNHMKAWQKQANYLNSMDYGNDYSKYSDNTNEINQTWYQVLRIAQRYGVKIYPRYYR